MHKNKLPIECSVEFRGKCRSEPWKGKLFNAYVSLIKKNNTKDYWQYEHSLLFIENNPELQSPFIIVIFSDTSDKPVINDIRQLPIAFFYKYLISGELQKVFQTSKNYTFHSIVVTNNKKFSYMKMDQTELKKYYKIKFGCSTKHIRFIEIKEIHQ